jgi:uncharacterized protein YlxW (UPF0749 family)
VTLAVDKELTRVEAALAAEEQRQSSLIQEFSSKREELTQRIESLESSLKTVRASSVSSVEFYVDKLEQKEALIQQVSAESTCCVTRLVKHEPVRDF